MQDESSLKIARPRRRFSVEPSPFNGVKLELGVILVAGGLLAALHARLAGGAPAQFALLGGYGVAGMLWILLRTRRVLRRETRGRDDTRRR